MERSGVRNLNIIKSNKLTRFLASLRNDISECFFHFHTASKFLGYYRFSVFLGIAKQECLSYPVFQDFWLNQTIRELPKCHVFNKFNIIKNLKTDKAVVKLSYPINTWLKPGANEKKSCLISISTVSKPWPIRRSVGSCTLRHGITDRQECLSYPFVSSRSALAGGEAISSYMAGDCFVVPSGQDSSHWHGRLFRQSQR